MKGQLSDKARLNHIVDAIIAIEGYVANVSYEKFSSSSEKTFATVKQLEIIGEASNRLSDSTRSINKEIEWSRIIALRNILVHDYYIIDHAVIWEIITSDIPVFKKNVVELISHLS